jgi:predicted RNA binding protein YcfA (HicA-like mRNA interferase family)
VKIPRDVTGADLAKKLKKLGYKQTRQTGSHLRLTTEENGEHHITIPLHIPLKIGTFSNILKDIAEHFKLEREDLLKKLKL